MCWKSKTISNVASAGRKPCGHISLRLRVCVFEKWQSAKIGHSFPVARRGEHVICGHEDIP